MRGQAPSREQNRAKLMNKRNSVMSSREESVEPHLIQHTDIFQGHGLRSSSAPDVYRDVSEDKYRDSKRRRTSPSAAAIDQADHVDRMRHTSGRQTKLQETKQSFQSYQQRSRMSAQLPTRNGFMTTSLNTPNRESSSSLFQTAPEKGLSFPREGPTLPQGTQAEPIELSDGDSSTTTDDESDDEAGDFLLDAMPELFGVPQTLDGSQSGPDTQLSLSDAAFESQSSHNAANGE